MLPSSIIAPADFRTRSAPSGGSLLLRSSGGIDTTGGSHPLGRGPLAQRAMRLLGIGGSGQAWTGTTQHALQAAFGSGERGASLAQPWLAARIMPTPSGYIRSGRT